MCWTLTHKYKLCKEKEMSILKGMTTSIHTLESLFMRAQAYNGRRGVCCVGLFFFLAPINNLSITREHNPLRIHHKPTKSVAYLKKYIMRARHGPMGSEGYNQVLRFFVLRLPSSRRRLFHCGSSANSRQREKICI